MKKLLLFVLPIGFLLFTACDEAESLLDVTETFTFDQVFVVDTEHHEFSHEELFDLAADVSVIDEYGNKIKEVTIREVRFWLTAHEGDPEQRMEEGSLLVSDPGNGSPVEIASLGTHVLQDLLDNPTTLDLNNAGVSLLGDLAANPPHRFMLHADASFNEGPLDFTLVVEFTARMTANPLN